MDTQTLILAIIKEARDLSCAPMLKTTLVKFLYLLDVYVARESQGTSASGIKWEFIHFGPFSQSVVSTLDELIADKKLYRTQGETQSGDREFVLYDLTNYQKVANLRDAGISNSIQRRIQSDMKRYAKNLPRLLDYVYFKTEPMADARPGEVLNFEKCTTVSIDDVRPIAMQRLRPKAIKNTRQKLQEMVAARKGRDKILQGPFDETYYSGLTLLDYQLLDTGLSGKAKLKN